MIRIARPAIPAVLADPSAAVRELSRRLATSPDAVLKSEDFSRDLYAHASVKEALLSAQHGKCAFCESQVRHIASGHVEHFRPKAGYKQRPTDPLRRPGYYWLAYSWYNLLFSCELCNSRHKGSLFPLADHRTRAGSPMDDLANEQPLFLNPAVDDPSAFIRFRRHVPRALKNNRRGAVTIRELGLRRDALNERRKSQLKLLRLLWESTVELRLGPNSQTVRQKIRQNEATLRFSVEPEAEYSAMARDYLDSVGWQNSP